MRWALLALVVTSCAHAPPPTITVAPDLCRHPPFCRAAGAVEEQLRDGRLVVRAAEAISTGSNGSRRMLLVLPDGAVIRVKWKVMKRKAAAVDNVRKEVAAYALQSLFLDEADFVVPPTVARCLALDRLGREIDPHGAGPFFEGGRCVLGVLAYWVEDVERLGGADAERMHRDPRYRRRIALLNLVTFLIDHRDTKSENFAIARAADPHAFALDNGMAFSGWRTSRSLFHSRWRKLIVDGFPRATLDRLARLTRADLDRLLVVAEFVRRDGELEPVALSEPLDPERGMRQVRGRLQLGLTREEIDGIAGRLRTLLERVAGGELRAF